MRQYRIPEDLLTLSETQWLEVFWRSAAAEYWSYEDCRALATLMYRATLAVKRVEEILP